jgi:hypothetical protein
MNQMLAGHTAAELLQGTMAVPAVPATPTKMFCYWLGSQDSSCTGLPLAQPVLRFDPGTGHYQMNLWWIAPWLADIGGSVVTDMVNVAPGDSITMAVRQLSSNSTHYRYQQSWGLSPESPAFGMSANRKANPSGSILSSCTFSTRAATISSSPALGPPTQSSLDACYSACCGQAACKAFMHNSAAGSCSLLAGYARAQTAPTLPGADLYVRGQAMAFDWPRSQDGCTQPASWNFGLVLELLGASADSASELPPGAAGVAMTDLLLRGADGAVVNPPTAAGAATWFRDGWSPFRGAAAEAWLLGLSAATGDTLRFVEQPP